MSYTDRSVQRRLKSNAPNVRTQAEHEKTLCNETVRRLFNMHIAIIYHGFTVVTLTALWYCGRNVGYSTFNIITGVMVYNYSKYV